MKTHTILVLAFVSLPCCLDRSNNGERQAAGNSAERNPEVINLGKTLQNAIYSTVIPIENPEAEEMYIFETTTTCGCLHSGFSRGTIPPQGKVQVEISVTKDTLGKWGEAVRFFSTSSALNSRVFEIKGETVAGPWSIESPSRTFTSEEGGCFEMQVQLGPLTAGDVDLTSWRLASPVESVVLDKDNVRVSRDGSTLVLPIQVLPSSSRGIVPLTLEGALTTPGKPRFRQTAELYLVPFLGCSQESVPEDVLMAGKEVAIHLVRESQATRALRFEDDSGSFEGVAWKIVEPVSQVVSTKGAFKSLVLSGVPSHAAVAIQIPFTVDDQTYQLRIPIARSE